MERQYKEVVTPQGKHKVSLKSWLTGREKREIQSVYLQDMDFTASQNAKDGKGEVKDYKISGGKFYEAQNKTLEIVIASVNGSKEKILDQVLDMHSVDFDFIINEIIKLGEK
jgi:hypothetical protein